MGDDGPRAVTASAVNDGSEKVEAVGSKKSVGGVEEFVGGFGAGENCCLGRARREAHCQKKKSIEAEEGSDERQSW